MLLVTGKIHSGSNCKIGLKKHNSSACPKCEILIVACVILFLLGTVFAITFVYHQSLDERFSNTRSNKNWINYRSQDTLRALVPVCLKKTRAVVTLLTRTISYILEIPIVWGATLQSRWNVWDGLMVWVGIIIFHLFFILILLRRAARSDRGKLVRSLFL